MVQTDLQLRCPSNQLLFRCTHQSTSGSLVASHTQTSQNAVGTRAKNGIAAEGAGIPGAERRRAEIQGDPRNPVVGKKKRKVKAAWTRNHKSYFGALRNSTWSPKP